MRRGLFITTAMGLFILATLNLTVTSCSDDDDKKTETPTMGDPPLCPDDNHPHAIDLGLGVKFACCNVGANNPWDIGYYFAWGETGVKRHYDLLNYKYYDTSKKEYIDIGKVISGTDYDVAHVRWKGKWRMPTINDISSFHYLEMTKTKLNNVPGMKITGTNGNAIFIPCAGYYKDNEIIDNDRYFYFWTGESRGNTKITSAVEFNSIDKTCNYMDKAWGLTVRPVMN